MLFGRVAIVALLAATFGAAAMAQSLRDIGGPSETPPSSYQGQMYVDSRGCVFLRAGFGGQVNWVARVSASRQPLCGYPPTFGPKTRVEIAEDAPVANSPSVAKGRAPTPTVATLTAPPTIRQTPPPARIPVASYTPAPVAVARPAPTRIVLPAPVRPATVALRPEYQIATSSSIPAGKIGCFTSVPVAERLPLRDGGSVVLCTRGDGTLTGARAPIYPAGTAVGASLLPPPGYVASHHPPEGRATRLPRETRTAEAAPSVPKGYKLAWTDDRLNPYRGIGTAEGQAAQDQVWTRDVPARLVADQPKTTRRVVYAEPSRARVSTKSEPVAEAPRTVSGGVAYVQVGTFGVPANAEGAAARLAGLGLPVSRSRLNKGGKALQVVLAGPFGDAGSAQAALRAARGAGFGDAFLR